MKNKLLQILSFFTFPAAVLLFSIFIDNFFNAYDIFPWIDIPMHFFGGFSVAYMSVLFLRFWNKENLLNINSKFISVLVVVCAVSFIAVLWEFWEYLMVYYFRLDWTLGYEDTLFDLFMGMLGGFFGAVIFRKV